MNTTRNDRKKRETLCRKSSTHTSRRLSSVVPQLRLPTEPERAQDDEHDGHDEATSRNDEKETQEIEPNQKKRKGVRIILVKVHPTGDTTTPDDLTTQGYASVTNEQNRTKATDQRKSWRVKPLGWVIVCVC
jgi:hypothetical protein